MTRLFRRYGSSKPAAAGTSRTSRGARVPAQLDTAVYLVDEIGDFLLDELGDFLTDS